MTEIRVKLREYQKALNAQSLVLALEPASDIYVESIANWFDMKKPMVEMESHFLDKRGDLVSLAGGQSSKELSTIWRETGIIFSEPKRKEKQPTPLSARPSNIILRAGSSTQHGYFLLLCRQYLQSFPS